MTFNFSMQAIDQVNRLCQWQSYFVFHLSNFFASLGDQFSSQDLLHVSWAGMCAVYSCV